MEIDGIMQVIVWQARFSCSLATRSLKIFFLGERRASVCQSEVRVSYLDSTEKVSKEN